AIWTAFDVVSVRSIAFAAAVLVLRPIIFSLSLVGSNIDWKARLLIGWFGPRGLSSLLLVLLPVFAGVPGAGALFQYCGLVVLSAGVVHGASLTVLRRRGAMRAAAAAPAREVGDEPIRISVAGAAALPWAIFVDVRKARSAEASTEQVRGALHIDPEGSSVEQARALEIPTDGKIVLYCA